ncbi:hypothetical protein GPECTOR_67g274 [Gonium pectorale]|uniref:C2 domain-containing protein n=1 Tax=Gonium pectorale TaxID=33097 RepID=A0A150G3N6_GONPE|nr:hypothetical protein GPECTOR_67g274 [Gonium pectorale]|eukprot:KXZ44434.1 hypothetical protein GPECTOR_67g274 [Gonium pectorale]
MAAWVQLKVVSGHDLPKTDLFGHIDPYVAVSCNGESLGRTATRDKDPNPVWDEDFFFEAEQDEDGNLYGSVQLDLYDYELGKDEHVGWVALDLASLGPGAESLTGQAVELPVAFPATRRGAKFARSARNARLAVQVVGVGRSYASYAAELAEAGCEAALDEAGRAFLLPLPDTDLAVWAGMRFTPRATQLLVVGTADPKAGPNPNISYDMSYGSGASLKLERLSYRRPVKLAGLRVWSELRAVNVPLGASLSKVRILERSRRLVDTLEPADVLAGANYMIGMPWLAAVKELSKHSALVDTAGQSIWLKMDVNQPQPAQLLQLDYRPRHDPLAAGPATAGGTAKEPALRIWSTTSELNRGYDLAFFGGGGRGAPDPWVSVMEVFRRPVPVLGGAYEAVSSLELVGAFQGEALNEIGLGCYEVGKPSRTWRFGKVLEDAVAAGYEAAGGGGDAWEGEAGAEEAGRGRRGRGQAGWGGGAGVLALLSGWLSCLSPRADDYRLGGGGGTGREGDEEQRGGRGRGRLGQQRGGGGGLAQEGYDEGEAYGMASPRGGRHRRSASTPADVELQVPRPGRTYSRRGGSDGGGGGGGLARKDSGHGLASPTGAKAAAHGGGGGRRAASVASSSAGSASLGSLNVPPVSRSGAGGGGRPGLGRTRSGGKLSALDEQSSVPEGVGPPAGLRKALNRAGRAMG